MSDILKRIRILVDTSSPRSILEQISGQIPRFFSGNDIRFEMSFTNNGVLLDANEIDQVHVEVKDFVNGQPPLPSDPALMSKFTSTLDDTSTLEDFVDGTGQQCVIEFTNAETSISAGSKFLVVWVTSSASPATILTVSTGTIRVDQSGSGPGQPAPDPIEQLLTVSVANASYLRLDASNLGSSAVAGILDDKADLVAGKVPLEQLPALVATSSIEVADSAARLALTEEQAQGKIVVQSDNGQSYMLVEDGDPSEAGDWVQIGDRDITAADITDSGATGRALLQSADAATAKGHLSLTAFDVGLGSVDDTSDSEKPVSTAQQAALDDKADDDLSNVAPVTGRAALFPQASASSSAATLVVDLSSASLFQRRNQDGSTDATLTVSTSNRAADRQQTIIIKETGSTDVTLVFPAGWNWIGPKPSTLIADTIGVLTLLCTGDDDSDVYAQYNA